MQKTVEKQAKDRNQHVSTVAIDSNAHKKDGVAKLDSLGRGAWARTPWRSAPAVVATWSGWGAGRHGH